MRLIALVVFLVTLLAMPALADVVTPGIDEYPFLDTLGPGVADPWGFYTGQSTSYCAWYWNIVLGREWHRVPGYGDAWGWPHAASSNGASIFTTPQVNAIISWNRSSTAPWGHVAIVRNVNIDGTIDVSEYNYIAPNAYSYRSSVTPAAYGSYKYIYITPNPVPDPSSLLALAGLVAPLGFAYRRRRH